VVAYGRGGAAETVVPLGGRHEPTGLLFDEQSIDGVAGAVADFEHAAGGFSPAAARRQALRFNPERFDSEFAAFIDGVLTPHVEPIRRAA
jgi:hypothetical protein